MHAVVIGDVHGCIDELKDMVRQARELNPRIQIYQIGDLLDKGPDQVACVRYCIAEGIHVVMGNHEAKHIRKRRQYIKGKKLEDFEATYQDTILNLTDDEWVWLESLPYTIQIGKSTLVHAGIGPHSLKRTEELLYIRYVDSSGKMVGNTFEAKDGLTPWQNVYDGSQKIIYGHNAYKEQDIPHYFGNTIGIDLGCVYGNYLCGLLLYEDGKNFLLNLVTKAKKVYYT
jgi:bis(5'-nucleosyl)-tetraphosphatase (symmetrical)